MPVGAGISSVRVASVAGSISATAPPKPFCDAATYSLPPASAKPAPGLAGVVTRVWVPSAGSSTVMDVSGRPETERPPTHKRPSSPSAITEAPAWRSAVRDSVLPPSALSVSSADGWPCVPASTYKAGRRAASSGLALQAASTPVRAISRPSAGARMRPASVRATAKRWRAGASPVISSCRSRN